MAYDKKQSRGQKAQVLPEMRKQRRKGEAHTERERERLDKPKLAGTQ